MFPAATAVVDHDRRLTYREFHEQVRRMGGGLQTVGIKPGDRVAFLAMNGEALLTAHFGVPLCGAVLVAMNTRLIIGGIYGPRSSPDSEPRVSLAHSLQP